MASISRFDSNPFRAAMVIGIIAGAGCYLAVSLKNRLGWDDALDVWGVHGMGGLFGTIALGIFASSAIGGQSGLLEGDGSFFMKEIVAVIIGAVYAFLFTYLMLMLINLFVRVKVPKDTELVGIDETEHGEKAYDEGAL